MRTVSNEVINEIKEALENISYGSIEIYVQDGLVTQITVRNIKKVKTQIPQEEKIMQKPAVQRNKKINVSIRLNSYTGGRKIVENGINVVRKAHIE